MVDNKIIKPEDITPGRAEKILDYLNSVHTPEEIAAVVEIPGRDVGAKLARNILTRRNELGKFTDLKELADVRQIGSERFSQIVKAIERVQSTSTRGPATSTGKLPSEVTARPRVGGTKTETARATSTSSRRIVRSVDILTPKGPITRDTLNLNRVHASTRFHLALSEAKMQIGMLKELIPIKTLPDRLVGTLLQPNGKPAARIQASLDISTPTNNSGYGIATTDKQGDFTMYLPTGMAVPTSGEITLDLHGANGSTSVTLKTNKIANNGLVGSIKLPVALEPLPVSIVASLQTLLPSAGTSNGPLSGVTQEVHPELTVGEDGHLCRFVYHTDKSVERFPYSVFIRLVEPRTSIVSPTIKFFVPGGATFFWPSTDYFPLSEDADVEVDYVDRVPVDQPISVDGFRDQLIGVGDGDTVSGFETVAMAGTLGLGYIVRMAQLWTPKGLTLGNLVYSLPLAPGEQQKVAIFERREVAAVRELEALSVEEQQRFEQETDASTEAVFTSAFNESARAGSRFHTESDSWGVGGSIIIFSAGGGGSSSSGSSSSWLEGHRDFASRATQDVHTSIERQASARRRALRTGMRLATHAETADVTTKIITNHNHTRALTLQYWEVLRLYEVSTTVEGVSLVCLVPMEIVRFLPSGQPLKLTNTTAVDSRSEILTRYSVILKHADILERRLPRQHNYGLNLLRQFAADPTANFQPAGSATHNVIHFSVRGTFLPFEEVYVSAVTKRGTHLGPVRLTGSVSVVPEVWADPNNSFPTQDALMAYLQERRNSTSSILQGDLSIPSSIARNDITGFEVTRRFQSFNYDLVNPAVLAFSFLGITPSSPPDHLISGTVRLSPQVLERELGGPYVWDFDARIHAISGGVEETYVQNYLTESARHQLPPSAFPIPALQLSPVLQYTQLLEIENMLQHVVNNTVHYSKAVWQSMTPEERAIILEGFTIGVPPGGIVDDTQNVPLLNCVENRVLGFYGNSMIMPFFIPRQVADDLKITTGDIQETLVKFHKTGFSPPISKIALPTRGVLGEAVLGSCPSAEKIDLTRFWNWADSPADVAPEISPVTLPTTQPSTAAAMQGPSALTGLQPLINNIMAAGPTVPGTETELLQQLAKAFGEQKSFLTELTSAAALAELIKKSMETTDKARADALGTTKELSKEAIKTVGEILKKKAGGGSDGGSGGGGGGSS